MGQAPRLRLFYQPTSHSLTRRRAGFSQGTSCSLPVERHFFKGQDRCSGGSRSRGAAPTLLVGKGYERRAPRAPVGGGGGGGSVGGGGGGRDVSFPKVRYRGERQVHPRGWCRGTRCLTRFGTLGWVGKEGQREQTARA